MSISWAKWSPLGNNVSTSKISPNSLIELICYSNELKSKLILPDSIEKCIYDLDNYRYDINKLSKYGNSQYRYNVNAMRIEDENKYK